MKTYMKKREIVELELQPLEWWAKETLGKKWANCTDEELNIGLLEMQDRRWAYLTNILGHVSGEGSQHSWIVELEKLKL